MRWLVLAAVLLLAAPVPAGAAVVTTDANGAVLVDGTPFLPIMSWLQCPGNIAHQASLGINTFVGDGCGGAASAYLDACSAQGAWGVMSPDDTSVAGHAALLGWIFGDEPDLQGNQVEPATLLTQYQALETTDPHHPTFLTLTSGFYSEDSPPDWMGGDRSRYTGYCQATDLVGFDIYPVYGWCRPDWLYKVGAAQAELATTYAPGKATYQWIEAVKTSGQWCDIAARGADDGPYPEEIRNEVWQALVHGATAVGYFTHSWECPGYSQFCLSAAQETELTRTNAQLTALTRPLLASAYYGGVTVVVAGGGKVDAMVRGHGGKLYVFAVSLEPTAKMVTLTLPFMPPTFAVQVYDESRTLAASGTAFVDTFDPLGVHIYVIDAIPGGDAGVGDAAPADAAGGDAESESDAPYEHGTGGPCSCKSASSGSPGLLVLLAFVGVSASRRARTAFEQRLRNRADSAPRAPR
jgi:hypothetical protein